MQPQNNDQPESPLHLLLRAKGLSDNKNYIEKNKILRDLLIKNPDKFLIDSDLNSKYVGLTHVPTSFKIHAPRDIIPTGVSRQGPIEKISHKISWEHVGTLMNAYAVSAKDLHYKVATSLLPRMTAWVSPVTGEVRVAEQSDYSRKDVCFTLEKNGVYSEICDPEVDEPWLWVKSATDAVISDYAGPAAQALMFKPSRFSDSIGGATPMASMLAGGLLTAGLGYGAGTLAETFAPDMFERNTLRKRLAMAGGLVGAAPGAALGALGMSTWDSPRNPQRDSSSLNAFITPNVYTGQPPNAKVASDYLREIQPDISPEMKKSADFFNGGGLSMEKIPVDSFNRMIVQDPFSPPNMQAATMGIVNAADHSSGGYGFISPMDIARVGMGMGAGYMQASIGGRVLGALVGLTPQAQGYLQQAGVIAGALKSVIPGMFGQ